MPIRAALIIIAAALTGCQHKPFTEYTSPDGKFKAIFPGEPKVSVNAAAGIVLKMYMVESWDKAYMIAWADVPIPDWESESRTKSRLFDARDGALAAVKGKTNNTTKTIQLLDRFPGIEFGGSAEGKQLRARAYIVGHRMYQLLVAARTDENLTSPEAESFFAAFEVLEPESLLVGSSASPSPKPTAAFTNDHPIESKHGRFLASYPTTPAKFTRTLGGTNFIGYASKSATGGCSVAYADLPIPGGESAEKIRERLNEARDAAIADMKGALQEYREITLGEGRPGLEFLALADGQHLHARVYLIGARLYHLAALGDESFINSKQANAFLESFKLLK
jgi:hypothetical protein